MFFLFLQVETIDDYDEYCHYVAGLVGLGLSKLFHASGSEDLASDHLSNSMGLFLQVMLWYEATTAISLHFLLFGSLSNTKHSTTTENKHNTRLFGGY
jgi:hypothetical protein